MPTNDEYTENVDGYFDESGEDSDFDSPPGSVDLGLGITINMGNFQSFKMSLDINEPYTGRPGDTREDKVTELFGYIRTKLQEQAENYSGEVAKTLREVRRNLASIQESD
jgi:hypothetical protein